MTLADQNISTVLLLILSLGAGDPLTAGMRITSSTQIEPGEYRLSDREDRGAVRIEGDGITVDFQGATLIGAAEDVAADAYIGRGIWITGANITIKSAVVRGYKVGIYAEHAPNLRIENCDVSRNFRQRLKSTPEREDLADWLYGHENDENEWLRYGAGIYLLRCPSATVQRCRSRNGQNGLCLVRCDNAHVVDNDFSFMSGWGLAMWRSSGCGVYNNKFDWCMRGYSHGVYSRGQDSTGILVYEQCHKNVFAYNSATHGGDGFFLYAGNETVQRTGRGGCNGNIVYRNDFSHAAANGIEATFSSGNVFVENILDECTHGVWAGYSYDTIIQGNRMKDCTNGVSIEHGRGNVIAGNEIIDTKMGVRLWWDDDRDLLESVYGKAHDGCPSTENRIIGNRFQGVHTGVHLADDRDSAIIDNTFNSTAVPIELSGNVAGTKLLVDESLKAKVRCGGREGVAFITDADAASYRTPKYDVLASHSQIEKDKGTQDAFLPPGARRGRKYIFIDEWGPYDFSSPRLFPSEVRGGAKRTIQVLGADGRFRVKQTDGDVSVSPGEGNMPGAIEVRAKSAGVHPFSIEVEAAESTLRATGTLLRADWKVRFYRWSPDEDPRGGDDPAQAAENWRTITNRTPIATTSTEAIDFAWGHAGPTPDGPSDQFATIATTTLALPAGAWQIETVSDDGVRVLIDDKPVITNWTWHGPTPDEATVTLNAGPHAIRIEHFEIDGYATLRFNITPADAP